MMYIKNCSFVFLEKSFNLILIQKNLIQKIVFHFPSSHKDHCKLYQTSKLGILGFSYRYSPPPESAQDNNGKFCAVSVESFVSFMNYLKKLFPVTMKNVYVIVFGYPPHRIRPIKFHHRDKLSP